MSNPIVLHRHTPLVVKDQGGHVFIVPIDRLSPEFELEKDSGLFVGVCGLYVWTGKGFTRITRVIRHAPTQLWLANTNGGAMFTTLPHMLQLTDKKDHDATRVLPVDEITPMPLDTGDNTPLQSQVRSGETLVLTDKGVDEITVAWIDGFMISNLFLRQWYVGKATVMRFEVNIVTDARQTRVICEAIRRVFPFLTWIQSKCRGPNNTVAHTLTSCAFRAVSEEDNFPQFMQKYILPKMINRFFFLQDGEYVKKVPAEILNGCAEDKWMFLVGYIHSRPPKNMHAMMMKRRIFSMRGAVLAQGVYIVLRHFFRHVEVEYDHRCQSVRGVYNLRIAECDNGASSGQNILHWETRPDGAQWTGVYELETEAGRFCAGVGNVIIDKQNATTRE